MSTGSQFPNSSVNDSAKIFNSAMVSSRADGDRNFSGELVALMQSPEMAAILNAVKQHSRFQGIPERQAAEQIIQTFRKLDRVWLDYTLQEGIDKINGQA